MATTYWVGGAFDLRTYTVGEIGFLIESHHTTKQSVGYRLSDHPPHKNISGEAVLHGWCGSYNDLHTSGLGLARVVRVCKNGRAQLALVDGASEEARLALDDLGYPDLWRGEREETA